MPCLGKWEGRGTVVSWDPFFLAVLKLRTSYMLDKCSPTEPQPRATPYAFKTWCAVRASEPSGTWVSVCMKTLTDAGKQLRGLTKLFMETHRTWLCVNPNYFIHFTQNLLCICRPAGFELMQSLWLLVLQLYPALCLILYFAVMFTFLFLFF